MYNINRVDLTTRDLELLKSKEIGKGTDGIVYRVKKGILYKIYHSQDRQRVIDKGENDVKIYSKGRIKNNYHNEQITYFSQEDSVRLRSKDAIYKAIERQEVIHLTYLPQKAIYINGRFKGCQLQEQKGIQIHYLSGIPLLMKMKIIKNVLIKVLELNNNYIYHTDLSNSPFSKSYYINQEGILEKVGHSHILINPLTLSSSIIDLDGKSTIYTEFYNERAEQKNLSSFNTLLIEFLFKIDVDELNDYDMYYELKQELQKFNISGNYLHKLATLSLRLEEVEQFFNHYQKTK